MVFISNKEREAEKLSKQYLTLDKKIEILDIVIIKKKTRCRD